MFKDFFFLVALLLCLCVSSSWGECRKANNSWKPWDSTQRCRNIPSDCRCTSFSFTYQGSLNYTLFLGGSGDRYCVPSTPVTDGNFGTYISVISCDTQAEADSVACLNSGKVWLDGVCKDEQDICEDSGGVWEGDSCKICDEAKPMPNECRELWNTGYNLQGYWSAVIFKVTYNECDGTYSYEELSNVPELKCSDIQDTTATPARCLAVIGSECVMQMGNGQTYNCQCDGNCQTALASSECMNAGLPSSDSQSSDSQSSDSQSSDSQSSDSQSSPSSSPEGGSGSGGSPGDSSGGDWEYNYSGVLDSIKWQGIYTNSNLFNIGNTLDRIDRKLGNGSTTPGSSASGGVVDSLHRSNQLLEGIANNTSSLNDSLPDDYFDVSGFLASSDSILDKLQNPDTTYLSADSIAPDTSNFKIKYSKFFLSNNLTRNGCYEFRVRSVDGWKIGDVYINFGNLAGKFDFCAIVRGIIRICGAILCLIMTIKAYRTAFASGDD